jgi:glutaredoxin
MIAQDDKVVITEQKKGKRIVLYAENTTKDTLNVFFMVNAEGYRRSASKPQLQDLPPNSITEMITLIELTKIPSSYTYELIVNGEQQDISVTHLKETIDIEKTITGRLVLFSEKDCEKCVLLEKILLGNKTQFRNFDIREDEILYDQFIKFIYKKYPSKTEIRLPVVWNKDHVIFGYDNLEELLLEING